MPTKPKIGRPKKPRDEKQRHRIKVNLTDAELAAVERAAGDTGIAEWSRRMLVACSAAGANSNS